jgi:hypothetical protein
VRLSEIVDEVQIRSAQLLSELPEFHVGRGIVQSDRWPLMRETSKIVGLPRVKAHGRLSLRGFQ